MVSVFGTKSFLTIVNGCYMQINDFLFLFFLFNIKCTLPSYRVLPLYSTNVMLRSVQYYVQIFISKYTPTIIRIYMRERDWDWDMVCIASGLCV